MIYLPDTNVFSRYLRGDDPGIKEKLESNLRFCRLSSVVLSELEYGAAKRPDLPTLRARVKRLREIIADEADYTCADAAYYGGGSRTPRPLETERTTHRSLRPDAGSTGVAAGSSAGDKQHRRIRTRAESGRGRLAEEPLNGIGLSSSHSELIDETGTHFSAP